jgi:2-polyprenyl-6-methoxyphenol hydroxylase-like FAD-dependent oxidoreductase
VPAGIRPPRPSRWRDRSGWHFRSADGSCPPARERLLQHFAGLSILTLPCDRHRRHVVDGEPVITGLAALGDAWACTNPSLGRGASIGLHACALRDLLLAAVAPWS